MAVFVDSAYFLAHLLENDQWYDAAVSARERLGDVTMVTTDEVLAEVLTTFCGSGENGRRRAATFVREALEADEFHVIPQSHQTFLDGLRLYEERLDKGYSLQDCVSMNVMAAEGINDVLTSDHHFEQEGFNALMKMD